MDESKTKRNVKFQPEDAEGHSGDEEQKHIPPFELTRDDVVAAFEFFVSSDAESEPETKRSGGAEAQTGKSSAPPSVLTAGILKNRLSAFFPNLTSKEYRFLLESPGAAGTSSMGQSSQENSNFTVDTLWELIDTYQQQFYKPSRGATNTGSNPNTPKSVAHSIAVASTLDAVSRFDPVKETFHVYDPNGTGAVDVQMLASIMSRIPKLEIRELSEEELAILVRTADFDQDGEINLDDFRHLVSMKGRFMKNNQETSEPAEDE